METDRPPALAETPEALEVGTLTAVGTFLVFWVSRWQPDLGSPGGNCVLGGAVAGLSSSWCATLRKEGGGPRAECSEQEEAVLVGAGGAACEVGVVEGLGYLQDGSEATGLAVGDGPPQGEEVFSLNGAGGLARGDCGGRRAAGPGGWRVLFTEAF